MSNKMSIEDILANRVAGKKRLTSRIYTCNGNVYGKGIKKSQLPHHIEKQILVTNKKDRS